MYVGALITPAMDVINTKRTSCPDIIFVGGIHGVGKTTFASALSKELGILTESAGALIKRHRASTQGNGKSVANVAANQNLLLDALASLPPTKQLLLDGHFCLLGSDDEIHTIPIETFFDLSLKIALVIYDSPANIHRRLESRDGGAVSMHLLERFQDEEVKHGKLTAEKLKIPFELFHVDDLSRAKEFIVAAI